MATEKNVTVPTTISKADKGMLRIIREAFENETGHDCKLTDTAILGIVLNTGGRDKFMEMDGDAQIALLSKGEEVFKGIAVSDPSISGIVSKFDREFDAELDVCLEAFVKSKGASIDIYGQFKRLFTKDALDEMPYPGSEAKDIPEGSNRKPDIAEKKAVAGGVVRTVFLNDLVYATPKGKAAQNDIDDCTKELRASDSVPRFKDMGKQEVRDLLASATQTRNNMRKMFRTAIQLHHKLSAIEGMPLVSINWIKGSDPKCPTVPTDYRAKTSFKVTRSPKPLWLVPIIDGTPDHSKGKDYSVSQVIAFNPDKALAMKDGGTVGDLRDSAKGEPETAEMIGEKMPEETMDTTIVVIQAKLANAAARAALRKRALEPNNEEMRASYCALYLQLRGFYQANEKWYDEYQEKQEAAATKEKAIKAAAAA